MSDVDQKAAAGTRPPISEGLEMDTEPEKVEGKTEEAATTELAQSTEAIPKPQPSEEVIVKEEKEPGSTGPTEQVSPGATEGLNFDSVLNEAGPNSFDLNLDFGNDDMGNQAFLSGTAFGATAGTSTDKPETSLPGEDSTAVPPSGGAFDLELQNPDGEPHPFPDQGTGAEDIMGPGESSFDDLFMETENLGDSGTGDLNQLEGDSLMNISELDDNWFT